MLRPLFIALAGMLATAGCQQWEAPDSGTDGSPDTARQDISSTKIPVYDRVRPVSGRPVPTFHMSAVEGSLGSKMGCLVLDSANRTLALVFARDSVKPEPSGGLLVEGRSLTLGERVRLGGSSTGGSAVGAAEIPPECRQFERWFVAPGSVEALGG